MVWNGSFCLLVFRPSDVQTATLKEQRGRTSESDSQRKGWELGMVALDVARLVVGSRVGGRCHLRREAECRRCPAFGTLLWRIEELWGPVERGDCPAETNGWG